MNLENNINFEGTPKICLNMIVRDEAHIIQETLESVYQYIDYYVICDTGSEDNTKEVIEEFFKEKDIDGKIINHEWYDDFGINRTMALKEAKKLCEKLDIDYIWIIDADDIVVGNLDLSFLDADCYSLKYGKEFTYPRKQIFKSNLNWKYIGVRHECPVCADKDKDEDLIIDLLEGDYYIDSRRLGSRSSDPKKYLKDALKLQEVISNDSYEHEDYKARDIFYCAQSWYDYEDYEKSIKWYNKRITCDGWFEEVYESYYKIAMCYLLLDKPFEEIIEKFLNAYKYSEKVQELYPNTYILRAEPLYHICKLYRLEENYEESYKYGKMAIYIPFPEDCCLFVNKDVYDYKILDNLSISSFYIGKYYESYYLTKRVLFKLDKIYDIFNADDEYYVQLKDRILENLEYTKEEELAEYKYENIVKTVAFYVGDKMEKNKNLQLIVDVLSKIYNVILIGTCKSRISEEIVVFNLDFFLDILINKKIDVDIFIAVDNLYINHMFGEDIKTYFDQVFLINKDINFKMILPNEAVIYLYNEEILNNILKNVDRIVLPNFHQNIHLIEKYYNIDQKYLSNIDDFVVSLDAMKNSEDCISVKIDIPHFSSNGITLENPHYLNSLNNTIFKDSDIFETYYKQIIKLLPKYPEPLCFLAKYYFESDINKAKTVFEDALKLINDKNYNGYPTFRYYIQANIALCLFNMGEYQESFDLYDKVLLNSSIKGEDRMYINNSRDENIKHLKDQFTVYPSDKIQKIVNKKKEEIKTMLSITSCKRFNLFEKTINSFINCCKDLEKIDYWLCIDDNSSEEDKELMKKRYPFFHFIWKNEKEKGHYISMNKIHEFVNNLDCEYLVHLEDDWHFVQPRNYIQELKEIIEEDTTYGQVLFNKNYSEEPGHEIVGGFEKISKNGIYYIEHDYDTNFQENNPDYPYQSVHYWPHFSFRPSLIKCSVLTQIGCFYNTFHFEMAYADEYVENGYKSVFYDTFSCIHIGKKTWENESNDTNSYDLNQIEQFPSESEKTKIYILSSDFNLWKKFKEVICNKNYNKVYRYKIDGTNIEKYENKKFDAILNLIKSEHDNLDKLIVLDENYTFQKDLKDLSELENNDILVLGNYSLVLSKNALNTIFDNFQNITIKSSIMDLFDDIDLKINNLELS